MTEENNVELNISHTFIKDLSFDFNRKYAKTNSENNVNISIDTAGRELEGNKYEVLVNLSVSITNEEGKNFVNFENIYGGVFITKNIPENLKDYMIYYDGGALIWTYAANLLDECLMRANLTPLNLKTKDYRAALNQTLLNRQNEAQ